MTEYFHFVDDLSFEQNFAEMQTFNLDRAIVNSDNVSRLLLASISQVSFLV